MTGPERTETIKERIKRINRSLSDIEYNPGRHIVLEMELTPDIDIRDFGQQLRACTEGALTGSETDLYSEAKFLQVRRVIGRFRGREGMVDLDRRWTRNVTDVRNWFVFAASQRRKADHTEHEHHTDSGDKSGGQKEKLAYTVLAASLAYLFGLEWGAIKSQTFRFVAIDGAFGQGYRLSVCPSRWMRTNRSGTGGDLDTHGFVMIDMIRHYFPRAGRFSGGRPGSRSVFP